MMDRKTILVVLGCLIAMVAWSALINLLFPPRPRTAPPPVATAEAVRAEEQLPAVEEQEHIEQEPAEPERPRGPEQTAALENEFVRVTLTSWGGGVRSVELLKHRANGGTNVVLNGAGVGAALALEAIAGADADAEFAIEQPAARTVVMRAQTKAGQHVTKTFSLGEDYRLSATVKFSQPAPQTIDVVVGTATPATATELPDFLNAGWLAGEKYHFRGLKHIAKNEQKGIRFEPADAKWAAVKNQFFTMILTPATNLTRVGYRRAELPRPADWRAKQPPLGIEATARLTGNAEGAFEFGWYAGPKEYDRLAALGRDEQEVMQFGFWGVISVVLLKSMKFFHGLIPNYGVAIILVTIVIKILFWPVQAKSIRSMKAMQKFQPMMQKLREKYKDDPQRLQQEMMKLYKEHKINPFAGCLPMLVQIPVFFAFFTMLRSAVELRGASFLWIRDLSQPDTVVRLAGFPLNPLPLLMGASMIWQMKLTPSAGDPKQQQIMMLMPLVFLFVCYNMSSGLVLYWTVQQFLSIAQQWWSMRQPEQPPQTPRAVAAGKTK